MLLALDTSTRQAGVALYDPTRALIAEQHWYTGHQHTVELMPAVADLLGRAGITPARLSAVGVALGPGSFTGVRVALAAAKGLALAQGLPLLGIPTLDVVAYPHQAQRRPVVAVLQAGRGRVCWAVYGHGQHGWAPQSPYALSSLADAAGSLAGPAVFAGELGPDDRALLAEQFHERATCLPPALALRRAGYLAELAWARFAAGQSDDPVTLSPIYLQDPVTFAKAGPTLTHPGPPGSPSRSGTGRGAVRGPTPGPSVLGPRAAPRG